METHLFQRDATAVHTARGNIGLLKQQFPNRSISRSGEIQLPSRSLDHAPLEFF